MTLQDVMKHEKYLDLRFFTMRREFYTLPPLKKLISCSLLFPKEKGKSRMVIPLK